MTSSIQWIPSQQHSRHHSVESEEEKKEQLPSQSFLQPLAAGCSTGAGAELITGTRWSNTPSRGRVGGGFDKTSRGPPAAHRQGATTPCTVSPRAHLEKAHQTRLLTVCSHRRIASQEVRSPRSFAYPGMFAHPRSSLTSKVRPKQGPALAEALQEVGSPRGPLSLKALHRYHPLQGHPTRIVRPRALCEAEVLHMVCLSTGVGPPRGSLTKRLAPQKARSKVRSLMGGTPRGSLIKSFAHYSRGSPRSTKLPHQKVRSPRISPSTRFWLSGDSPRGSLSTRFALNKALIPPQVQQQQLPQLYDLQPSLQQPSSRPTFRSSLVPHISSSHHNSCSTKWALKPYCKVRSLRGSLPMRFALFRPQFSTGPSNLPRFAHPGGSLTQED